MSKSRPFSIYLLKTGHDASNSLKENHHLKDTVDARSAPERASLFILDSAPTVPWWKHFFGIQQEIKQVSKGALVFLPVRERTFALSFGHVYHKLKDESYEYDFGLRVTLNCVDPNELKSTDTLEPGAARRQRTQVPIGSDLTYFDFDRDSSILKCLTGKVKGQYANLFKHATGSSSLLISTDTAPTGLIDLCGQLLDLYNSDEYRVAFPDIQNIAPVRDPTVIEALNEELLQAFRAKNGNLYLAIPEIVDYQNGPHYASFSGVGPSMVFEDVFIDEYYSYLESNAADLNSVGYEDLKCHGLNLKNENDELLKHFSILNCLIFDAASDTEQSYHLSDGKWYRVENSYLEKLKASLDPLCIEAPLRPFAHESEGKYNEAVAEEDGSFICLDMTNISPRGETQIEPCDLYSVDGRLGIFYHIKVSTLSPQLSHLFNQGTNSIELLKLEPESVQRLRALIDARASDQTRDGFLAPIEREAFGVCFGIVTHKDKAARSENLPLFSRISLMRNAKALQLMGTACRLSFIEDQSEKKTGIKKERKKRAAHQILGAPAVTAG